MDSPLRDGSILATLASNSDLEGDNASAGALALDALMNDRHPVVEEASAWANHHFGPLSPGIDRERWRLFADAGFQAITTATDAGGLGYSTVAAMLAFEGLGHGCPDNGLVFALSSQVFATQNALRSAATPGQLERHLPGLLSGETFGAFAMTEPDAGSDSGSITTTAVRIDAASDDPHDPNAVYEISGEKCWITLGPIADLVVVFATTDPALGRWGITAFVVETGRAGVELGPAVGKLGLHSSPFGSIRFDRCRMTAADRLGPEGGGGGVFSKAVEGERAFLFAGQLGATRRVLEQTIEHARSTATVGSDAGANKANRIADMALDLETARLLVYKAAALNDRGQSVGMAAALAKLQTSEMAVTAANEAMGLHGSATIAAPEPIESDLLDAVGGLAYSGTSDIQRMIVARLLRVDAPLRSGRQTSRNAHVSVRPDNEHPTKASEGSTIGHAESGEST